MHSCRRRLAAVSPRMPQADRSARTSERGSNAPTPPPTPRRVPLLNSLDLSGTVGEALGGSAISLAAIFQTGPNPFGYVIQVGPPAVQPQPGIPARHPCRRLEAA